VLCKVEYQRQEHIPEGGGAAQRAGEGKGETSPEFEDEDTSL